MNRDPGMSPPSESEWEWDAAAARWLSPLSVGRSGMLSVVVMGRYFSWGTAIRASSSGKAALLFKLARAVPGPVSE